MSINIQEFATKYSLKPSDLIQLLAKAGVEVDQKTTDLTNEQMDLVKKQINKKKSRGTLSLKLKPKETVVVPEKSETTVKQEEVLPAAKPVVSSEQENVKTVKEDGQSDGAKKPANSQVKKKEVVTVVAKKKKPDFKKSKRERAEAKGDKLAAKVMYRKGSSELNQKFEAPVAPITREIMITEWITVADLANQMALKSSLVLAELMNMGVIATINQSIDHDTASLVVEEMGHKALLVKSEEEELLDIAKSNDMPLQKRAPVVTVMGHVDHGKTTLLDAIRKTQVADGEEGGITQHIGAYSVKTKNGSVTFIDTPGHEAFTAMRARGAKSTDMVVLVVAADDGVMPQTIEGIQHARAAEVPIVVAVNKIDKEGADIEKVKGELAQHDVLAESWGGDILFQEVSAKVGTGVDELLENLALQAEILELKAPDQGLASGTVIESVLDKGLGPVATLLVQAGCLHKGDIVLIGSEYGRIRSMSDSHLEVIDKALPSMPVKITGLSGVPAAGDAFLVMANERQAREYAANMKVKQRDKKVIQAQAKSLDQMFKDVKDSGSGFILNVVLKSDTHGSAEALAESVKKLSSEQIMVKVIASGVGRISESDVNLAYSSSALLVGFNVRADASANKLLQQRKVEVFYCGIIYDLIEKVKAAVKGLEEPVMIEKNIGLVDVREVFRSSKHGVIAGSMVLEGLVKRNALVRVLRDGMVIHKGVIVSLRRVKDDVSEVKRGLECGVGLKDYSDFKEKDQLEIYVIQEGT